MDAKRILMIVAGLGGLALIIALFVIFRGETPDNLFYLNLAVSIIAYCLLVADVFTPIVDFKDRAHRTVGSLSFRWTTTIMYVLSVVAVMVVCNYVYEVSFTIQALIHCVLVLLLLGGIITQLFVADHTGDVHHEEQMLLQGVEEMKRVALRLNNAATLHTGLPADVKARIKSLCDSVRYISPCNNPDAAQYECRFVEKVNDIIVALPQYELNKERIERSVAEAEIIFSNRKSVYSI